MSLFSRLDRVRNREREESESGMFAVPDLGPRDANKPASPEPASPQEAEPQASQPQASAPQTFAPPETSASSPLQSVAEQAEEYERPTRFMTPAGLASRTEAAPEPPTESPATSVFSASDTNAYEEAPEAQDEWEQDESEQNESEAVRMFNAEPVSLSAPKPSVESSVQDVHVEEPHIEEVALEETPEEEEPVARSPFDRLMAARMAKAASEPESPPAPVIAEPEPTPVVVESPTPARPQSQFQPAPPLDEATLDTPLDVASGDVAPVERFTPVAEATPAPSPMSNYSSPRPDESPSVSEQDSPSAGDGGRLGNRFSARFAARETLDRRLASVDNTAEAVPEREMSRTGAEMTLVEEDPSLSERETKLRALFRHKHLIFDSVFGGIDPRLLQNPNRETIRPIIERAIEGALREFNLGIEGAERNWLVDEFVREITDVGPLVPLLDDPGVNKIIVTGANDVSIEKLGRVERTGISFRDDDHLLALVRRIAEMTGGRIDAKVPLLDRPLPDGARIRAKVPPLAPQPTLTVEKSTGNPFIALRRANADRVRDESLPYNQLRERIQLRLLREFEGNSAAIGNQERLRAQVEEMINQVIVEERVAVTRAERAALVMDLLNEIVGLGPIEPLLNDPEVDEVMVNGPYQIYVERKGKLEISSQRFRDNAHVLQVIDRIVAPLGRRVDEKSPMVDGRLRDGSRFNAIIPPLALGGPTMTIRKFARDPFTMTDLINFGSLTRESAQFLQAAVEGRLNIVVSGGTGSGKTTTLNVLSSFIPASERIVTIEDAAELQLRQEHVVRLETRPPNIEGVGEIAIRDLVRNALRMRPDRIVVGECRGGEALDMLQAMNTGHDGSLTTAHSNGPRDTLKRMETMVMMAGFDLPVKAIREQIAMAVQLIVHQERMRDGKRRVTAITEIVGMEGDVVTMQDLFRFEQERVDEDGRIHGSLAPTGLRPKHWDTMVDNGVEISMELFHPRSSMESGVRGRLGEHRGGIR